MAGIDWTWIKTEFDRIASDLSGWRLIGEQEFERLKLSRLTYGLIKAPEQLERGYGKAIYVARTGEGLVADMAAGLALELNLKASSSLLLPAYLIERRQDLDHLAIVREAVSAKRVSHEFIASWGRLQNLHARYQMLMNLPETSDLLIETKLHGAEQSTEIHRHWYAFWLKQNARSLDPSDRVKAGQELAEVCRDIAAGRLKPWHPYPKEWYARILNKEGEDLRDEYYKLGRNKLYPMLKSSLIGPHVLPPLSRSGFENQHPGGARAET